MRHFVVWLSLSGLLLAQSPSVPAGTRLEAKLETPVQTETSEIGDNVTAVLMSPVRVGGRIVMARGTRLHGRIETLQAATRDNEGRVRLVFREVQLPDGRRAEAWITNSFEASPPRRGLKYGLLMGAGAVAGALVGGESARVAGILGGLLAGFVLAGDPHPEQLPGVTLKAGRQIDLEFREDLIIP